MKHYYRTECSTELGKMIRRFLRECDKAARAADVFAQKLGATSYYPENTAFEGSVACLTFDEKKEVNTDLWKCLGKDSYGNDQWVPAVEHRLGVEILPRRDYKPANTAFRVYNKRSSSWGGVRHLHTVVEWAEKSGMELTGDKIKDAERLDERLQDSRFCKYVDLWREDVNAEMVKSRKTPISWPLREIIRIEKARISLPVVTTDSLFRLLKADLMDGLPDDGKPKFINPVTPIFFEWGGRYYISCRYPCKHEQLEEITEGVLNQKLVALRQAQKMADIPD